MELRHLRYFVAVAEEENVSRAAMKLHVSQPGLSRQIRDLEDELGFKLLERKAKSVSLTDAGRTFLSESKAVLQRVEEAVKSARAVATGNQEELHVGYAPTLTVRILPGTLREFEKAMPHVRVKLHDMSSEEMLAGLREGKLDLVFSVKPANGALRGLRFEEIARERLRLAVAPSHPLVKKRFVSLEEAAREPLVAYSREDYADYYEMLDRIFSGIKTKPRIAEEHDGVSSLISAIEAGHGVTITAESIGCMAGPRLKLLPIVPEPDRLVIGLLLPKSGPGMAAQTFLACAGAAWREK